MNELKKYLEEVAAGETVCSDDDFSAADYAGGNFDDAYRYGVGDGEILFARNLLEQFYSE